MIFFTKLFFLPIQEQIWFLLNESNQFFNSQKHISIFSKKEDAFIM